MMPTRGIFAKSLIPLGSMPSASSSTPLRRRPPLLLRSAGWRLAVAALLSALLLVLWRWALAGGAGS